MKYKISDLARLLDVSTNTVRRYEEQGYIQSDRDGNSGYRYYNDDSIFGIIRAKLLRKYGFKHEEMQEMEQYDIYQKIAAYEKRMSDMDEQIAYMTYLRHRIKDDCVLMKKAAELDSLYEKECVEQIYVLYKEGAKLLLEPERLQKIHEFLYDSPEIQQIYIIPKEELDKGNFVICSGWAVKAVHMEKYNMTENEYTKRYPKQRSVMGISKIPASLEKLWEYSGEELKNYMLGKHLKYIEEHNMQIAGDVIGIVITKALENGKDMIYLLMSIPIENM